MAGVLKKIPCCSVHGKPCYIKTGTREGPTKGKTFFICGNQEAQCSFSVPANGQSTTDCPRHRIMRDLQAVCRKNGEIRCYYRCTEGRKLKLGWCGFEKIPFEVHFEKPLTDITNRHGSNSNGESVDKRTETSDRFHVDKDGTHKLIAAMPGKENERLDTHFTALQEPIGKSFIPVTEKPHNDVNDNEKSKGQVSKQTVNAEDFKASAAYSSNASKKNPCEVILIEDDDEETSASEISTISNTRNLHVDNREVGQVIKKTAGSNNFPSCEILLRQQNALERELETKKGNLKWVNLQLLPDKGQRLIAQIKEIEQKLAEIRRQTMEVVEYRIQNHALSKPLDAIPESKNTKGIGQNVPGLQNHQHQNQLLFQAPQNSISERLYDGRMTQSKLKQVGRITRDAIEALHRSLESCPSPTTEIEDPIGLNVDLMPHQRQALAWLLWREKQMPSGGILADDMGLGKTLTSIALVLKDKQIGFIKKSNIQSDLRDSPGTLVICPASLVHHWQKEIERRVKPLQLTLCLFHGQMREKNLERLSRYDIVLTTYSIVSMDMKDLLEEESCTKERGWLSANNASLAAKVRKPRKSLISQIHWRRIILDEAHIIKNHKCATSTAACCLEAETRWALTGTPVQNNTRDLYAIVKFLRCSPFNEVKVWNGWIDDKSTRGGERMNTLVRSLLLRRTKQQHLTSLPARASKIHAVSLEAKEKEVYDLLQKYSKNMLTAFLDNQGKEKKLGTRLNGQEANTKKLEQHNEKLLFGKKIEELLEIFGLLNNRVNAGAILLMVLRLRQCCSHLSLLCEIPNEAECKEECNGVPLEEQMMNLSIVEDPFKASWNPEEFMQSFVSSKLHCLMEELQKLRSISKTGKQIKSVIVSQWTKMLDIIALHLQRNGFKYDFITGRVTLKKRSEIVEDFNTSPNGVQVILLSLRAGGVGLNLIGGSNLFLFDQHWNPALESQACDRIYRVGQENDVIIHRFLCTDTIEEKIAALQEKKKTLAESVLQGGKQIGNNLTLQDLRVLFGV